MDKNDTKGITRWETSVMDKTYWRRKLVRTKQNNFGSNPLFWLVKAFWITVWGYRWRPRCFRLSFPARFGARHYMISFFGGWSRWSVEKNEAMKFVVWYSALNRKSISHICTADTPTTRSEVIKLLAEEEGLVRLRALDCTVWTSSKQL